MNNGLFMQHPKTFNYLFDDAQLICEVLELVGAEIGLHALHDHIDMRTRIRLVY